MNLSVRRVEEADEDHLRALRAAAEAEVATQRGGTLHLAAECGSPHESGGEHLTALVEIDDVPVGFLEARMESLADGRPVCRVGALFVHPEAREVGAGECLVDFVTRWALELGAAGIDVHALPGARETKNFFESSGFVARLIVMHRPLGTE